MSNIDSSPLTKSLWPRALAGAHVRRQHPEFVEIMEAKVMQNQPRPLSRESVVSLREITAETVRIVSLLDPGPEHDHLVAPNAFSIAQAHFSPDAWFRAVYADEVPVGFVMVSVKSQVPGESLELHRGRPSVGLWRFMIDQRYRGFGFGSAALKAAMAFAKSGAGAEVMLLSFVPEKNNPEPFYLGHGFVRTGEMDDGEVVMARDL